MPFDTLKVFKDYKTISFNSYKGEISKILEDFLRYEDKSFGESKIYWM